MTNHDEQQRKSPEAQSGPLNLTSTEKPTSSPPNSIASKYIDPESVPLPGGTPNDPRANPLALLAQTCSNIGKDLQPTPTRQSVLSIETSSNSSIGSSNGGSNIKLQKTSPPPPPPPPSSHHQQQASKSQHNTLKRHRPQSPNHHHSRQSFGSSSEAVTNALNALEHAVRGNSFSGLTSLEIPDAVKMNRFALTEQQPAGVPPPAKISKPNTPIVNLAEQANLSNNFAAQLLQMSNKAATVAPLANNNNTHQQRSMNDAPTTDQQQLYAAYVAQLMRQAQQNLTQPAHPSPLPATPPPTVQTKFPDAGASVPTDMWTMVLQSYTAKQLQQQQQEQSTAQPPKIQPIRPQARSATPGTFVCNWLIGSSFCGKKFALKEQLVDHVSSAHCSNNVTSASPTAAETVPAPPAQDPVSVYQNMIQNYLASLMGQNGSNKVTPVNTVSPSSNSLSTSSSRSENSPVFPNPANAQISFQSLLAAQLPQQQQQQQQQQQLSPQSPPRHLNIQQQQQPVDQSGLVASLFQQLLQQQQQQHQQQHQPQVNPAELDNFFTRQALQQQRLQAAVLAAAAKGSVPHF